MSTLLPDPVPLDAPPGSPDAVDDAAQASSLAARLLDELTDGLISAGPAAWQGRDADAAEERRARIAGIAADAAEVLHRVALRLAGHADVLREVVARTAVLRAAQGDEFAAAGARVAVPLDPTDPFAAPPEDVLAALHAAEADRAAEHARLTARLDDDAGETNRVLAAAAAVVAGTPRYDPDAALLHLAALLPAWGTPEVAHRGFLLARAVSKGAHTEEVVATAEEDLDLASDPAYAAAFLAALGPELTRGWLITAWSGAPADDPRTELLARVLAGLDPGSSGPSWLAGLLDAAAEEDQLGMVAGGLGAVLARAEATGLAGPPPALASAWAGTLARDERSNGQPTDLGPLPAGVDPAATDPFALLSAAMVDQHGAEAAARTMTDPDAWSVVLSRFWNDPAVRDGLIAAVADAPAESARPALTSSLVALGTGLADGDPDDSALYLLEHRVKDVAPVLTTALLRHPDVLVAPLADVAAESMDAGSATALRGLAVMVALDEGTMDDDERGIAGDRIAHALAVPHPAALQTGATAGDVAVPAAFVAVREQGARLAYAMSQHVLRDEAEARAVVWRSTVGLPFAGAGLVPGWGPAAAAVETGVKHVLATDASWSNTPDRQWHHPVEEAPAGGRKAYVDTLATLGTPAVPQAPSTGLVEKETAAVRDEILGGWIGRGLRLRDPVGGLVGGVLLDRAEES